MKSRPGYAESVAQMRREKDEAFKHADWSPIDPHERVGFGGLSYFPPDERWRVKAKITRLPPGEPFEMGTSTGEPRLYLRYARLDFETPSGKAALIAYQEAPHAHGRAHSKDISLFVPFRDATSLKETYGAGRYLDLEEPDGDSLTLDFNLAYNPYCAYSEAYSCPLPPPENWLSIPVVCGERNFAK